MNIRDLELAGVALYKCEGAKLRKDKRYPNGNTFFYAIEFTNSEPPLVKIFVDFLVKVMTIDINAIKCELFLYEDQDIEELHRFWEGVTGIDNCNFHKTIVFKAKSRFKPSKYGTCKIRLSNKAKYLELDQRITKRLGKALSLIK